MLIKLARSELCYCWSSNKHETCRKENKEAKNDENKKKIGGNESFVGVFSSLLVVIFLLFVGVQQTLTLAGDSESCHLRELEICVLGFASVLQNPNGIPVSEQEFKRHCEYMRESSDCFHSYANRCFTPNAILMSHMFSDELAKLENDFCTNGTELRTKYMKNAPCLRQVQRKHQRKCATDFQVGFQRINKIDTALQLTTFCCNTNRLMGCVFPKIEELCGKESLDLVKSLVSRMIGRTIAISCRVHKPNEGKCVNLLPAEDTKAHTGRNTSVISRILSAYANVGDQIS